MNLKTLIKDETGTDAEVYAWVLAPVPVQQDASNGAVLTWSAGVNALNRLRTFSSTGNAGQQGIADAAIARIEAGLGISLSKDSIQTELGAMVSAGMFTDDEVTALNDSCTVNQPRWRAEGLHAEPNRAEIPGARA